MSFFERLAEIAKRGEVAEFQKFMRENDTSHYLDEIDPQTHLSVAASLAQAGETKAAEFLRMQGANPLRIAYSATLGGHVQFAFGLLESKRIPSHFIGQLHAVIIKGMATKASENVFSLPFMKDLFLEDLAYGAGASGNREFIGSVLNRFADKPNMLNKMRAALSQGAAFGGHEQIMNEFAENDLISVPHYFAFNAVSGGHLDLATKILDRDSFSQIAPLSYCVIRCAIEYGHFQFAAELYNHLPIQLQNSPLLAEERMVGAIEGGHLTYLLDLLNHRQITLRDMVRNCQTSGHLDLILPFMRDNLIPYKEVFEILDPDYKLDILCKLAESKDDFTLIDQGNALLGDDIFPEQRKTLNELCALQRQHNFPHVALALAWHQHHHELLHLTTNLQEISPDNLRHVVASLTGLTPLHAEKMLEKIREIANQASSPTHSMPGALAAHGLFPAASPVGEAAPISPDQKSSPTRPTGFTDNTPK